MKIAEDLYAFMWRDMSANNCNTYFIDGSKKIIIDPGHRHLFGHVAQGLERIGISPDQIDVVIITHAHPDHIEASDRFRDSTLVTMGREEYDFMQQFAAYFNDLPEPLFVLQEGDVTIGNHAFQILSAPGHSPGSVCIYWPARKALFTGDVVFNQGVGRTDLPGGSGEQLKKSIKKLAGLDVEYLLPGHGEIVSGKQAVKDNFTMIERMWFSYL